MRSGTAKHPTPRRDSVRLYEHLYQNIRRPQDAGQDLSDTFLAIADFVQAVGEFSLMIGSNDRF
jgi:hypothetical protein